MIYTHLAAALAAAAIASVGAWQTQNWRLGGQIAAMEAKHATERAQSLEAVRKTEQAFNLKYQGAINAARTRENSLRRDRDFARNESDGLRDQAADAARRLVRAPPAAVLEYANTANELFAQCSRSYQGMASQADGHAADAATCRAAWPVTPRRPDAGTTESNQ